MGKITNMSETCVSYSPILQGSLIRIWPCVGQMQGHQSWVQWQRYIRHHRLSQHRYSLQYHVTHTSVQSWWMSVKWISIHRVRTHAHAIINEYTHTQGHVHTTQGHTRTINAACTCLSLCVYFVCTCTVLHLSLHYTPIHTYWKMCREYSIHNTTCMYIQLLTLSGGCRGLCNTERTFPLPRKLSISSSEQNSCACEVGEIPSHQEWGYQPGVIHTYWLKFLWAACTQWRREHRKCSVLSLFTYSQCTHTHSQTGTHAYTQVHTPDHTSIFYLGLLHYIMVGMSHCNG